MATIEGEPGARICDTCGKRIGPRMARRWDPGIGDRCTKCVYERRTQPKGKENDA